MFASLNTKKLMLFAVATILFIIFVGGLGYFHKEQKTDKGLSSHEQSNPKVLDPPVEPVRTRTQKISSPNKVNINSHKTGILAQIKKKPKHFLPAKQSYDAGLEIASIQSPCSIDTPWESIQPRDEISLFELGEDGKFLQKKFNEGMKNVDSRERWACLTFPDGFNLYKAKIALKVETGSSGIKIDGAKIIESNYADNEMESCLENLYSGSFFPVEGLDESRYIIDFELIWYK